MPLRQAAAIRHIHFEDLGSFGPELEQAHAHQDERRRGERQQGDAEGEPGSHAALQAMAR